MKELLIKHGQSHVLDHLDTLTGQQKKAFEDQIRGVDFDLMHHLYQALVVEGITEEDQRDLSPLKPDVMTDQQKKDYHDVGLKVLNQGQVAVLQLAGGQGSRLGHDGPKGTFSIGLPGGESLFELHAKSLLAVNNKAQTTVPWLVMTSETNHHDTVAFFKDHDYFAYPQDGIIFFNQGMLPALDFEGKLIIESPGNLAMSPDGNGGCFIALKKEGLIDRLLGQGVKWLFIFGVDNAIVNIADPAFVGYADKAGKPAVSKVVKKERPDEKVGILCYNHKRPAIVEYTEMTEADTLLRDDRGDLVYNNANILNFMVDLKALNAYLDQDLSYHLAIKKIPFMNQDGQTVKPSDNNGYKFESFIFDIFPHFSDMGALQVERDQEFGPVKNKEGVDSPETARVLYLKKHAR